MRYTNCCWDRPEGLPGTATVAASRDAAGSLSCLNLHLRPSTRKWWRTWKEGDCSRQLRGSLLHCLALCTLTTQCSAHHLLVARWKPCFPFSQCLSCYMKFILPSSRLDCYNDKSDVTQTPFEMQSQIGLLYQTAKLHQQLMQFTTGGDP